MTFEGWGRNEFRLFDEMPISNEAFNDGFVQNLYDMALFNSDLSTEEHAYAMDSLKEYLWDEYGVDFDDVFDWEDYREHYEAA